MDIDSEIISRYVSAENIFQPILGLNIPIYIERLVVEEYIDWSKDHYDANDKNTMHMNFTKDPVAAIKKRALQISSRIKTEIDNIKYFKEDTACFTINFNATGKSGSITNTLYCELLTLKDKRDVVFIGLDAILKNDS
jgi:hypothetical protein